MSIFLKSEHKILELVYDNPGIRLSEIMRRARVSASTLQDRVSCLLKDNIIIEKKIIGGKKVLLKNFYPNFESEEGKYVFSLVEFEKRKEFFKNNAGLVGPFRQLASNVKNIKIILIFGSFASYSQTKDSDLDILILGDKIDKDKLKKEIERAFVTFNHEISPRIETFWGFRKNKSEAVYQTIIKNHIIIKGASEFIGLLD